MIRVDNKALCCGCSACLQKCPKQCITMEEDFEGFLYPKVDEVQCVHCGLCEKVCHELHPFDERQPLKVLAAMNKDETIRMQSSSGGIFYLLAEKTISEGGVVFGARFDEDWQVMLDFAETMEDVKPFMGSKYVQARTENAYRDAETFLKKGRKVLFSGTPCQVAGLYHYLGKQYEALTTVDFVCHGVPSPKVWRRYLHEVVPTGTGAISNVQFRNKRNGWKKYHIVLSYHDKDQEAELASYHGINHYMRAFLGDMILRPSCHECKAKCGRSHSDITIADFWGIHIVIPGMDDDKGTGLVLVNTDKGMNAFDWNKVRSVESSYDVAYPYNAGMSPHTKCHPKRKRFFEAIDNADSIIQLINRSLQPSLKHRVRMRLGNLKRLMKRIVSTQFRAQNRCL